MAIAKYIPSNKTLLGINQFLVMNSNDARLKIYYKLAALLRNKFTLMDALDRIWNIESDDGKHASRSMAIAIAWWLRELEKGLPFSNAIDGWAPMREKLMLSVGDVSKLEKALVNVIKVSEGSNRIIRPILSALTYPIFMLGLSILIIVAVGIYMVPPLLEFAGDTRWTGNAASLVAVSDFARYYWWTLPLALSIAMLAIYISFANLTGRIRITLDKFPPWSLYRMFIGVSWLMSLAALVESGTPIAKALQALRANSSPYLKERIDKTLSYMKNGDNLGTALKRGGFGFPEPELIGDLEIYSELDNFEETLNTVATDYLDKSVSNIQGTAQTLNSVSIIVVAVLVAWITLGVFQMQGQVQATLQ